MNIPYDKVVNIEAYVGTFTKTIPDVSTNQAAVVDDNHDGSRNAQGIVPFGNLLQELLCFVCGTTQAKPLLKKDLVNMGIP